MSRAREFLEMSQVIDPLEEDLTLNIKLWLERVWGNRDKNTGINIKLINPNLGIYQIEKARISSKKYNFIFQIIQGKCTFFSRYIISNLLRGLPKRSLTQTLLWKDKSKAEYGIDSFYVTEEILFPMTNSLLCDIMQTKDGIKAWDYIVYRFMKKNCKCGVYDNLEKKFTEFNSYEEYKSKIQKFRGNDTLYRRYQICVYQD